MMPTAYTSMDYDKHMFAKLCYLKNYGEFDIVTL